ncbi:hypothetical protein H5410_032707 [Solanum commersonii]|uniref:Protein kinase domain-containing protein n=1 Tax=Solanum commersonii TaxID=4109 RepID=A0A9J5YLT1_SOLCO|nr:hypothetical protein H5410_032707 [Solanum commersonii]
MKLSNVYMVTGSLDNRLVLVRFNNCEFNNSHRDIAITAQMSHLKNMLRLVGCCLEFEEPVMVYEYVEGISLSDLLFKKGNINRKSSLSWGNRLRISNKVASAIVFLHTEFTKPIIHRDLKAQNVIIDKKSGVAKIVDFSLSISLPPGELEVQDRVCGTIWYIAPEHIHQGIITQKTDVYNFGILLFQLLTGKEVCGSVGSDDDVMDRADSKNSKETTDFEKDNSMHRMGSAIPEETIDFENLPPNLKCTADKGEDRPYMIHVARELCRIEKDYCIKEGNVMDIADPIFLKEDGIEIRQQLEDYLDLVKRCTSSKEEDIDYT